MHNISFFINNSAETVGLNITHLWTLICTLIGALSAFLFNIYLHKRKQTDEEATELKTLYINCISIINQLLCFKMDDKTQSRITECQSFTKYFNSSDNFKDIGEINISPLIQYIITSTININSDLVKLGFISEIDPDAYWIVLLVDKKVKDFNADILNLNNHINKIISNNPNQELGLVYSDSILLRDYTNNTIDSLDSCLAFLNLTINATLKIGRTNYKRQFKKLSENIKIDKEYINAIPTKKYLINRKWGKFVEKYLD